MEDEGNVLVPAADSPTEALEVVAAEDGIYDWLCEGVLEPEGADDASFPVVDSTTNVLEVKAAEDGIGD